MSAQSTTPASDRELVITRIIAAPPAGLFRAWTTQLPQWWGPHGMTTPFCEMELRPGGSFRTVMRAPDGTEYPTRGVFLEIVPNERIVFTDGFDPGWTPSPDFSSRRSRPSNRCPAAKPNTPRARSTGPRKIGRSTRKWASIKVGAKASTVWPHLSLSPEIHPSSCSPPCS